MSLAMLALFAVLVAQNVDCASADNMMGRLLDKGQEPIGTGASPKGAAVVFVGPTKDWTIVLNANGWMCVLAEGTDWAEQ